MPKMQRLNSIFLFFVMLMASGCSSSLALDKINNDQDLVGWEEFEFPISTSDSDVQDDRWGSRDCEEDEDCNDWDPCTRDSCKIGLCSFKFDYPVIELQAIYHDRQDVTVLDVDIYNNRLVTAEGEGGVRVFDIRDLDEVELLAEIPTASAALSVDWTTGAIIVAESDGQLELFSTDDWTLISTLLPESDPVADLETEIMHLGRNDTIAIASGYSDGYVLLNLTDLAAPTFIAHFETSGRAMRTLIPNESWAILADALGGFHILNFEQQAFTRTLVTVGRAVDMAVSGNTALTAEFGAGLSVVNVRRPDEAVRLSEIGTTSPVIRVATFGRASGVALLENGTVGIFDLSNGFEPWLANTWQPDTENDMTAMGMAINRGRVAVALGSGGVVILRTGCE